jgi:hypothetical protein
MNENSLIYFERMSFFPHKSFEKKCNKKAKNLNVNNKR